MRHGDGVAAKFHLANQRFAVPPAVEEIPHVIAVLVEVGRALACFRCSPRLAPTVATGAFRGSGFVIARETSRVATVELAEESRRSVNRTSKIQDRKVSLEISIGFVSFVFIGLPSKHSGDRFCGVGDPHQPSRQSPAQLCYYG
jgi:hypothetical protein